MAFDPSVIRRLSTPCRAFPLRVSRFPAQFLRTMHVHSLPMRWGFGDNYCYVVVDESTKEATIIDPAAPDDVLPRLKELETKHSVKLTSITNTHHHYDHSDGNAIFHGLYPTLPLYAGKDSPLVSNTPRDGEVHKIGQNLEVKALHTPCHTQDSICWHVTDVKTGESAVFTGDTLFNCGCGRFFEGDANEMHAAMAKLGDLPLKTVVYPGHEYTKSNVKFALSVDGDNKALQTLQKYCDSNEKTTGVFTLKDELEYNPFMRTDDKNLQSKVGTSSGVATMAQLRKLKDRF